MPASAGSTTVIWPILVHWATGKTQLVKGRYDRDRKRHHSVKLSAFVRLAEYPRGHVAAVLGSSVPGLQQRRIGRQNEICA